MTVNLDLVSLITAFAGLLTAIAAYLRGKSEREQSISEMNLDSLRVLADARDEERKWLLAKLDDVEQTFSEVRKELEDRISKLRSENARLKGRIDELQNRVAALTSINRSAMILIRSFAAIVDTLCSECQSNECDAVSAFAKIREDVSNLVFEWEALSDAQ